MAFPRDRRVLAALTTAVALVAAGLAAMAALRHDSGPSLADLPDGWRYESRGDLVVMVPDSWGYRWAPDVAWCTDETEPDAPYVDSAPPVYAVPAVGCDALGVGIEDVPDRYLQTHLFFPYPGRAEEGTLLYKDWTQYTRKVGDTYVAVLTDKTHLDVARRIIASAQQVDHDQFGCTPHSPVEAGGHVRPADAFDVTALDHVDSISVCQYYLGDDGTWTGLVGSRQLTGQPADDVLRAIQAAPVGGGPDIDDPTKCDPSYYDFALTLRLVGDGAHDLFGYYQGCAGNGFDDGTQVRALTRSSCLQLFNDRVQFADGSGHPDQVCLPADRPAQPPRDTSSP